MDLTPKLLAAADMCATGEEVNVDELAFLLRYAADELGKRPHSGEQQNALLTAYRKRLLARCDLLNRPESESTAIQIADIEELLKIEDELDALLQQRFPAEALSDVVPVNINSEPFPSDKYRSGQNAA